MSDQIVDSLQIDNSPDGGSVTETYDSDIQTNLEAPDESETVSVVEGYDRRRGYRKAINATILDPAAHTALAPIMKNRHDVEFTFNWKGGSTTVVSATKAMVMPVVSVEPDNVSVWYDTDTSATDTPGNESSNTADSSWTELSEPLGNFETDFSPITRENGRGLPFYIASVCRVTVPMFYDSTALSNLRTEDQNENEIRLAIETSAGEYLIFGDQSGGGVEVEVFQNPSPSSQEVNHFVAEIYQTGDLDNIITYPTNADPLFYGAEIMAEAFAHSEGDILTENR